MKNISVEVKVWVLKVENKNKLPNLIIFFNTQIFERFPQTLRFTTAILNALEGENRKALLLSIPTSFIQPQFR